jgi:phenylalanyl-tRNA synthetase beta chain
VGEDRRSLAFRLRLCADDHTLTEAEIATIRQACIDAAAGELAAVLR